MSVKVKVTDQDGVRWETWSDERVEQWRQIWEEDRRADDALRASIGEEAWAILCAEEDLQWRRHHIKIH